MAFLEARDAEDGHAYVAVGNQLGFLELTRWIRFDFGSTGAGAGSAAGASLRRGLEFLRPYNTAPESWPHTQLKKLEPGFLQPLLDQAAQVWTNAPATTPVTLPGADTFIYREPMRLHVFKPKDWKDG